MANEAVIVEKLGEVKGGGVRYTCADANAISKGTLLWFSDPKTISGAAVVLTTAAPAAGIANTAKEASDGQVTLGVDTDGIYDLLHNGGANITAGQLVKLSGQNMIAPITLAVDIVSGLVLGKALEDSDGTAAKTIQVKLVML